MEAIFGVPSTLSPLRKGYSAGVKARFIPEPAQTRGIWSPRLWIGILAVLGIFAIGAIYMALKPVDRPGEYSVQLPSPIPDAPELPTPASLTPPPQACAGRIDAHGVCIVAPPPVVPALVVPAAKVAVPEAAPAAATAQPGATDETKPPVEAIRSGGPCSGTGYEHMEKCPPALVLKADSALSAAYAAAIAANIDRARLSSYSQHWSQLREKAAADPEATADEFANMTSQLNALIVAEARPKP